MIQRRIKKKHYFCRCQNEITIMFYKLIENKRNEWLNSEDCTIQDLLNYIEAKGMMRDAQVEAIKTYLYLKIGCTNRPLWQLFTEGRFNSIDLSTIELNEAAREALKSNVAAVSLLQYSLLKDKDGKQIAPQLESFIKQHATEIDFIQTFKDVFYGVNYTDYLFSLPMGAGKTYLMAAFIYLDLYFAQNEPNNPVFAHNFLVMAPSGLKSSIVPSLKHIQEFDPSWIIPDPTATQLKRLIKFEILDEQKTAAKSNRIKNPNAQKINYHQPLEDLMGLVAITNAEKVILDKIDQNKDSFLLTKDQLKELEVANELRDIIGAIPNLAIYIDEVHHASDGDIKLRQVVSKWAEKNTFNSVLGFSGTPYLDSAERVSLAGQFSFRNTELSNVVYYYPLIDGIDNFLKKPSVKYANSDTVSIVRSGVTEFLNLYKDLVYENGTYAKLAIYCVNIDLLEEIIHPLVSEIVGSYGLDPSDVILKYHDGNKKYPKPEGSEAEFASLDTTLSKKKVVLLVQIGKEGWDCKSLTGVILPQRGACPTNMVLQTSCRCLRQVTRGHKETALIWMNQFNADTLNNQLKQQQNISLQEFNSKSSDNPNMIERFSRLDYLKVPPIDFYQLKVSYETLIIDEESNTAARLSDEKIIAKSEGLFVHLQDMTGRELRVEELADDARIQTSFNWWVHLISKESFGTLPIASLKTYESELRAIFDKVTIQDKSIIFEDPAFDHQTIRSLIRRAFAHVRDYVEKEEILPLHASLLQIEKLTSPVEASDKFYPLQDDAKQIVQWDNDPPKPNPEVQELIEKLKALGQDVSSLEVKDPHPERDRTYHYLPYRFDSPLERDFLSKEVFPVIGERNLEVYFNGDDALTEFKIKCYKQEGKHWRYLGYYYPDFLLIHRTAEGEIHQVVIIETKGKGFAPGFVDKRTFMETEFLKRNNEKFGYKRFDFLYLEDSMTAEQRQQMVLNTITSFFTD